MDNIDKSVLACLWYTLSLVLLLSAIVTTMICSSTPYADTALTEALAKISCISFGASQLINSYLIHIVPGRLEFDYDHRPDDEEGKKQPKYESSRASCTKTIKTKMRWGIFTGLLIIIVGLLSGFGRCDAHGGEWCTMFFLRVGVSCLCIAGFAKVSEPIRLSIKDYWQDKKFTIEEVAAAKPVLENRISRGCPYAHSLEHEISNEILSYIGNSDDDIPTHDPDHAIWTHPEYRDKRVAIIQTRKANKKLMRRIRKTQKRKARVRNGVDLNTISENPVDSDNTENGGDSNPSVNLVDKYSNQWYQEHIEELDGSRKTDLPAEI